MRIEHGDCLDVMRALVAEGVQVDSIVTDPPAGIGFMNTHWDKDKGGRDQWVAWMTECAAAAMALVKPGGHAFVWSLPRTSHWTGWAWENAGWQPRDTVLHIFGVGFPKSLDVSKAIDKAAGAERAVVGPRPRVHSRGSHKLHEGWQRPWQSDPAAVARSMSQTAPATDAARQWEGWGTALKPAHENWWLFRKPLAEPTVAANVLRHGTGALNIDGCRVEGGGNKTFDRDAGERSRENYRTGTTVGASRPAGARWPANLCHDGSPEVLEAFAAFGESKSRAGWRNNTNQGHEGWSGGTIRQGPLFSGHADSGSAARFFYSAKASRQDRAGSKHPTVKPVSLMRWLVRLVTPPGGTVLDPFAGSGTTGQAAREEGFNAILIEREAEYVADIQRRLRDDTLFAGAA